jgi:hypothetical protein
VRWWALFAWALRRLAMWFLAMGHVDLPALP